MTDELELLIIGGGPAGLSTARSYRDAGGRGAVGIITDEQRMPYRRPPLTKELLRGEADEDELPIEPEEWLAEHDVRLIGGRAVAVRPDDHAVTLSGGRGLGYATCVLATGAEPTRLPVPGVDDPAVRVIRSLDDFRELQHRLRADDQLIVVGSGFLGCEIAASLCRRGHRVTLLSDEPAPNARRLGEEAAAELQRWLLDEGVILHMGVAVDRIERDHHGLAVTTGAVRVQGRIAIMATGVAPRSELAQAAGLELADGAIPVDGAMRTRRPDLLAAGDVCAAQNVTARRPLRVEHWGDALAHGEVAGRTAAGVQAEWAEVPGFWSTIGSRTLKYAAWGDGYDQTRIDRHANGGFTAWYGRNGQIVGVLTHEADEDYDRGRRLIAQGAPWV